MSAGWRHLGGFFFHRTATEWQVVETLSRCGNCTIKKNLKRKLLLLVIITETKINNKSRKHNNNNNTRTEVFHVNQSLTGMALVYSAGLVIKMSQVPVLAKVVG